MIIAITAHQDMSNFIPRTWPARVTTPQIKTSAPINSGQKWNLISAIYYSQKLKRTL